MTRGGKRINAGRPEKSTGKLIYTVRLNDSEKDFITFSRIKKIDLAKLKNTLITIFAFIFLTLPCNAMTLKTGIEYNVDSARNEAFENINYNLPESEYKEFSIDNNAIFNSYDVKNGHFHAGVVGVDSRKLVSFYKWNILVFYGVQYDNDLSRKYYYSPAGKLLKFDITTSNGKYPYKSLSYDAKGELISINFAVSPEKAYLFNSNKKLIGYWLNNQFYKPNGKKDNITRHF
jgi:hypothetical protein